MSTRLTYTLGLAAVVLLLLISLYLQYVEGIMPCPLCSMQRLTFGLLGILFLIGILIYKQFWSRLIINSFCIISSGLGIFLASRQIWIQNFPSASGNECSVSLEYMLSALPISEVLQKIFHGSVECAQRGWEFLHLNMAEWSLIWFTLFLLVSFYLVLKELKWHH